VDQQSSNFRPRRDGGRVLTLFLDSVWERPGEPALANTDACARELMLPESARRRTPVLCYGPDHRRRAHPEPFRSLRVTAKYVALTAQ
jgi:hypothetical protein